MLNDLDICDICAAIYADQPDDFWTKLWPNDGSYVGLKRIADKYDVIVWRGSTTLKDWLDDFSPDQINDPYLGMVHAGFYEGVKAAHMRVEAACARPIIVTGHSLGAAHALIHGALLAHAGADLMRVTTFGSPRPGGSGLSKLLINVAGHDYKNDGDGVTDVPFGHGYQHPRPMTQVEVAPDAIDAFGPLAAHHIKLYRTALLGLFPPAQ